MRCRRLAAGALALLLGACAVTSGDDTGPSASDRPAPGASDDADGDVSDAGAEDLRADAPQEGEAAEADADEADDPAEGAGTRSDRDGTAAAPRPDWLGTRELPRRPDGLGEVQPTPPELVDRRLPPPEPLPPPDDDEFTASLGPVPDEVVDRSTWGPDCPVGLDDLRYVTLSFWGFDERAHTGELLVHASAAEDLVGIFESLFEARFPIEEMRVISRDELDAPPTGGGNVTTAFVCRSTVGGSRWSGHAFGLAIDVNPFHNPYVRGEVVVPELASAYLDRDEHRPGMIQPGDAVTQAFAEIGWGWGGTWRSSKDWMHFSASGR